MDLSHLDGLEWCRSSKCDAGACVEVAALGEMVLIRDSAEPGLTPLAVRRDAWWDFVSSIVAGHFEIG